MAMVLYPRTLKLAQSEIDQVLGAQSELPPSFEHIDRLPYVVALCKEVFRWMPVAPGGFPHYSDKDDVYNGYAIRRHTMVIPNIWSMQRDEDHFPNPSEFLPERFLRDSNKQYAEHDPLTEGHYAFGFGRRACPGKFMGAKSIWICIAQMIWAFDITHASDDNGDIIPIDVNKVSSGINIEPYDFDFQMRPRTERRRVTIENLWSETSQKLQASGSH